MIAIAFVHNILRRHPSCNVLLHKPEAAAATAAATSAAQASNGAAAVANGSADAVTAAQNGQEGRDSGAVSLSNGHLGDQHRRAPDEQRLDDAAVQASGQDPYQFAEEDPAESRAIESSLWELDSLRNHYCPQVCTLIWGCILSACPWETNCPDVRKHEVREMICMSSGHMLKEHRPGEKAIHKIIFQCCLYCALVAAVLQPTVSSTVAAGRCFCSSAGQGPD